MPTEILFAIGCVAMWMACGAMMLVKHRAAHGRKASIVLPVMIMAVAIICVAIPKFIC